MTKMNRLYNACDRCASQFSVTDKVPFEDMYALLRKEYRGDPPLKDFVLRLCARLDPTPPPDSADDFSEFFRGVIQMNILEERPISYKSEFKIHNPEDGKLLKKIKCRDISAKYYALLAYNKAWRNNWNHSLAAPTITMPEMALLYTSR